MSIKQLPQELINKIAAGEVVERPASVIKELIENALDAKATSITVELVNGGFDVIRVDDDGVGMDEADVAQALVRHATSKIEDFEDLMALTTMGFRGEALATIAAVSRFSLETVQRGAEQGTKLTIVDGGQQLMPAVRHVGTAVTVGDLFYNVPARKKFLKSMQTEYAHCIEVFTQHCIINHSVSWKLLHNGKVVIDAPKTERRIDRIRQVLGADIADNMLQMNNKGPITVHAYIGNKQTFRASKKFQYTYVNSRPVNDYMLGKAIKDAFSSVANDQAYPAFVIDVVLDPALVDVNVHPRKTEVKFQNPNDVFRLVRSSVKNLLVQNNILTSTDLIHSYAAKSYEPVGTTGFLFKPTGEAGVPEASFRKQSLPTSAPRTSHYSSVPTPPTPPTRSLSAEHAVHEQRRPHWKIIGQIHKSYIVVENEEGFLVIDQHAAAERVNYEKFLAEYHAHEPKSQKLLMPLTLSLTHREVVVAEAAHDILTRLGFSYENFGGNAIVIHTVPQDLVRVDISRLFKGIIDDLDQEQFDHLHSLEEKQHLAVKYASCRGAIMFNDALTLHEQQALIDQIRDLPADKLTCCHGRPFMKQITKAELEKVFHRI